MSQTPQIHDVILQNDVAGPSDVFAVQAPIVYDSRLIILILESM